MSERAEAARGWQIAAYGDSPETWAALDHYRERGWPVDDRTPQSRARVEGRIWSFQSGYRAALEAPAEGVSPQPPVRDMGEADEYGICICDQCGQQVPRRHRCAMEPTPVSPVEPNICICPACLGSGGTCNLCGGTGEVQDLPVRRLFPVEPTPEPPTGAPAPCVWRPLNASSILMRAACCDMWQRPEVMVGWTVCPYCGHALTVER